MTKQLYWIFLGLLPIVYIPWGGNPQLPRLFVVTLAITIGLGIILFKLYHSERLAFGWQSWLWIAFLVALGISCIYADDAVAAAQRFFLWLVLALLHATSLLDSPKAWNNFTFLFVATAALAACWGILQSFNPIYINTYPAFVSTFGNINLAGSCMAIALILATFPNHTSSRTLFWTKWVLSAILVIYLVRTGSRAAWIAVAAGFCAFGTIRMFQWKKLAWSKILKYTGLVLGILSLAIFQSDTRSKFIERWQELFHWQQGSVLVRYKIWNSTCMMIAQHPFGVGLGQFSHSFYKYRDPLEYKVSQGRVVDHPHNSWLLILAEAGWLAFVLFLALVGYIGIALLQKIRAPDIWTSQAAITLWSAWLALLVLSLVTEPWLNLETGILLPLMSSWVAYSDKLRCMQINKTLRMIVTTSICFLVIWLWAKMLCPWIADIYFDLGQQKLKAHHYSKAEQYLANAVAWHPHSLYQLELGRSLWVQKKYVEAVPVFQKTIANGPELEAAYIDLGLALSLDNRHSEAIAIWRKAQAYFPASTLIYQNLVELLLHLKEGNWALDYLFRWQQHYPNIVHEPSYQIQLGRAHEACKDAKAAMLCYIKAKELNPNDANASLYLGRLMQKSEFWDSALTHFQEAVRLGNAEERMFAYCGVATILEHEGQQKLAITHYLKARQACPEHYLPCLYLAQVALEYQQNEFALKYLQEAKKLGFRDWDCLDYSLQKLTRSALYQNFIK